MDRGFDCNKYYEYFIKNNEKFIIGAKKNRNNKTVNILELAKQFKGKYKLEYADKGRIKRNVKSVLFQLSCANLGKQSLIL